MIGNARESGWFGSPEDGESYPCGCSMLSRIRLRPRNPQAFATMRCSLGWALHDDSEVAKCLAAEGPGECWKTAHNWRVAPAESPRMAEQTRWQIAAITHSDLPEEAMPAPPVETISGTAAAVEVIKTAQAAQIRVVGNADGDD